MEWCEQGNSMKLKKKAYKLGTQKAEYILDQDTGQMALVLLPRDQESCFEMRRTWLEIPEMVKLGMDKRAWEVGNLCHLSLSEYPQGKGAGETLKYGPATKKLHYKEQNIEEDKNKIVITTILACDWGYEVKHCLVYRKGDEGVMIQTEFINTSDRVLTLDFLTSVSLDNLSPFAQSDLNKRLVLHRFYGGWSLEGKHREEYLEDLNLERSWMCAFPESERFGSTGSYPVHRYFPMACVEDKEEKVLWGIQLEAPSAWQMELSRDGDCCSFSAGIADIEFGGWSKRIRPGEKFKSTRAFVSSGEDLDQVCGRLLDMHKKVVDQQPESEQSLPIIFNDWCASYGEPSHVKTVQYARKLKGSPVKYIVIDAGWTESPEKSFGQGGNGDWDYSVLKFPKGLGAVSREVKALGFQLGIWFELEVTTEGAKVYDKQYDHMHLTKNGSVINTGGDRTFWDFRNPKVKGYLREKVTDFLRKNEITYLKIDYNASIGAGCDGAESPGEGLRRQMEEVQNFLRELRSELPELIIENCAAGGHRLEASFMRLTAMSSFSDAHECRELPYIAANLQRLVLARQNQIWVVINEYLTEKEIYYRLASGFLGRFCLSGNIAALSASQWNLVKQSMEIYDGIIDIIRDGTARVYRTESPNMHHPEGIQIVDRSYRERHLFVIHSFTFTGEYEFDLQMKDAEQVSQMGRKEIKIEIIRNQLKVKNLEAGDGVILLAKERKRYGYTF